VVPPAPQGVPVGCQYPTFRVVEVCCNPRRARMGAHRVTLAVCLTSQCCRKHSRVAPGPLVSLCYYRVLATAPVSLLQPCSIATVQQRSLTRTQHLSCIHIQWYITCATYELPAQFMGRCTSCMSDACWCAGCIACTLASWQSLSDSSQERLTCNSHSGPLQLVQD
jgi:hypothetical protein